MPPIYPEADVEKTQGPIHERGYLRGDKFDPKSTGGCTSPSRPYSDAEILAELFKYHAPNEVTIPKYAAINQAAKNFAEVVLQNCPAGNDRVGAINCIRTARMVANAAISLDGLSL
ncbi:MAG TPA: hypothetical protein VGG46_04140 [Terriglobales bacterium]|jgi:hypothetical protein